MMKDVGKSGRHHESKHAHDGEREFKVMARRNRLLGLWVAEKFGFHGDAAQAYAKEVVMSDLEEPGDDDVVRKVMGDFRKNDIAISESELRAEMARLLGVVHDQLASGQ